MLFNNYFNEQIFKSELKTKNILNDRNYQNIVCSISGGSDSDIMLDLCNRTNKNIHYVWFDTGLEYQATKEHLEYLEKRYNINIERIKAVKPIPLTTKEYGQPFLNKRISDYMERLQRHNFKWEDGSFEYLYKKYPKCKASLRWWCNAFGDNSKFNIEYTKYLKEYIMKYPPTFKISNKCCLYAKKKPIHNYILENKCDLNLYGVRKAEGGARATAYKNCFTDNSANDYKIDEYRPIFYYTDEDKKEYEHLHDIVHSKCYTEYGLKRTGCVGCPFNKNFNEEIKIVEKYEPKLYKALYNIFGQSYEYTNNYRKFVKEMKER